MIEPEDQTECEKCGRIVGRDETTKHGCLICEEFKTEFLYESGSNRKRRDRIDFKWVDYLK